MRDLSEWPLAERRGIVGVFTDIDDTLTTNGAITPDALQALTDLHSAGLHLIAITGRPVGWSLAFAATWPVDAIVAENGAVALLRHAGRSDPGSVRRLYQQDEATRAANRVRMQQVAQRILHELPGARLAQDSGGRETDIAIDHSEFSHLDAQQIEQVCALMRAAGMTATVSSIHINGWYGNHNKFSGARWIVQTLYERDLMGELDRWVCIGDSTNDEVMFSQFPHSVGVANIRRFEQQLVHGPRYVTPGERGAGVAELARALLAARSSS